MIEYKDATFIYPNGSADVFDNLNLTIADGHIYGLLGKNGSGKSTMLLLMAGLLRPTSGEVTMNGVATSNRLPETLSDTFIVPDEFDLPAITMNRYVKIYAPFYHDFSKEILTQCLDDFGLSADIRLDKLSLGEKKKIYVSFAVATRTRLLIMDEPTNGMDIPSKSIFRKMIARDMTEEQTIIISTHQIHDIESLLEHVLIIKEDKDVYSSSMAELMQKYTFEYRSEGEKNDDVLYSEPSVHGNAVIAENHGKDESTVNIELLFNAVQKCYIE
jgi:ABC-2 type transport system ATP-binding protein